MTKENLLDLIPSEGSIKLGDAAKKLNLDKKVVNNLAKELSRENLVKINSHFLSDSDLMASNLLIWRRGKELKKQGGGFKRIVTPVDTLLRVVRLKKKVSISEIATILDVNKKVVERWAKCMEDLVSVEYPVNIFADPVIKIKEKEAEVPKKEDEIKGNLLESYRIMADNVPAEVKLFKSEKEPMPLYMVELPYIGEGTLAILKAILDKLTDKIQIQAEDVSDPKRMIELKNLFFSEGRGLIKDELDIPGEDTDILAGIVLHTAYGLGNLEILMNDDWLEEVCVNTSHIPLTVYHKKYGWVKTNLHLENEKSVYNYAAQIGRKVERNITNLSPIMDAHLLGGDRVCASLFPISSFGNTITIRKFARKPWTIAHFISPEHHTFSKEIAAFLWLCFQYELNVIVGGGTASGKTSALNSLCSLIQPTQRVVSIEDTREINLPKYLYWNWIPLTTREKNPEGKGEITMLDLILASLRMRPDRIIVGEIRRKKEAEVLFEAMHTGHSVYSTIHADTAMNLKRRLLEPPIELSSAEVESLHLVIIQYRDRTTGARKTFEVAEIIRGGEGKEFDLNYLFRWNSRAQEFTKINESKRIIDDLNLHTGKTREEIKENLKGKETVLQWMLDNKIYDIDSVGEVMDHYYRDPEGLLEDIKSKKSIESKK